MEIPLYKRIRLFGQSSTQLVEASAAILQRLDETSALRQDGGLLGLAELDGLHACALGNVDVECGQSLHQRCMLLE